MNNKNERPLNQDINNPEQDVRGESDTSGDVELLREQLGQAEEEKKGLKEQLTRAEEEKEVLREQLREAEARIESLQVEIKELKERAEKAEIDSIHDSLTKLKTRKYFKEEVEKNISAISAPGLEKREEGFNNFSILFCDIDHFKIINDTYGHSFGDEVLKKVGQVIEKNIRNSDTACRWGGEEIVVGLPGADEQEASKVAEKIRKALEEEINQEYSHNPQYSNLKVSLSIGVSFYKEGLDFDQLIKRADEAMYLAKKDRNCVKTYSDVLEQEKADSTEK